MGFDKLPKKIANFSPKEITYHGYGSKYRNRSCRCAGGHIHDSMFEAGYCDELLILKRAGEIAHFEIQKVVELVVKGQKICRHYVDFYVVLPSGAAEFHEAKGFETEVWRIKRKLTEALFPDIPYRVIREKRTFRSKWRKGWKR